MNPSHSDTVSAIKVRFLSKISESYLIFNVSSQTGYAGRILYPFATGLIRQSVLFLLLRLFPYKTFRRVVIAMIIINVCTSLVSCAVIVFQCIPINDIFNPSRVNMPGSQARCLDAYVLAISIPATNLSLDVAVALLPVKMILTISLPGRSKAMILGMLGLGTLCVIPRSLSCCCC